MTTIRSNDPAARRAVVVGLGEPSASLGPLIRHIAAVTPIDWVLAPDLSACLYEMALRRPDLLILARAAVGRGEDVLGVIARCRPNFAGGVLVADSKAIEVYLDCAAGQDRWLVGPLATFCADFGWSLVHGRDPRAAHAVTQEQR